MPSTSVSDRPARWSRSWLLVAIFAGGCVGAVLRAALGEAMPGPGSSWPWATFVANLAGTAALAYLATRLQERLPPSSFRRPLLGTGVCGALTTFSTLQVEVVHLGRNGHELLAAAYLATTLAAGFLAMAAVTKLVRRTWTR